MMKAEINRSRFGAVQTIALAISSTLAGTSAIAQDFALEEIVVTAQKRVSSLQDVPISVSAVSGESLSESGLTDLESLQAYVPNLAVKQGVLGNNIAIRGVASGDNQSFEQSVGMYVDGIAYPRAPLSKVPMFDMERVEVVRGPQSILFGKNSIGGAISMTSAKPTSEFEGSVSGRIETEHDEHELQVVVNGALTDSVYGRLALHKREIDGWVDNEVSGTGKSEEEVVRASLLWETNDLVVFFKAEVGEFEDTNSRNMDVQSTVGSVGGLNWLEYANQLDVATNGADANSLSAAALDYNHSAQDSYYDSSYKNFTLQADYETSIGQFSSITAYVSYDYDQLIDLDFTGSPMLAGYGEESYDQYSQEFRLVSPGGERVDYILGAFYQESDLSYDDDIRVPANSIIPQALATNPAAALLSGSKTSRAFEQDSSVTAVFAQLTWNVSEEFRTIWGLRYTHEKKDAKRDQLNSSGPLGDGGVVVGDHSVLDALYSSLGIEENSQNDNLSSHTVSPLITIQWDVTDNVMLYASYTEGYKSGGFDLRSNADPVEGVGFPGGPTGVWEFDEEKAKAFELGAKSSLFDGRAELNLALYRTEYTDLQSAIYDSRIGYNVQNVGEADIQGFEIEALAQVTENLSASLMMGYINAEFEEVETDTPTGTVDLADDWNFANTPEKTASLKLMYNTSLGSLGDLALSAGVSYRDETQIFPQVESLVDENSYTLWDASAVWYSADEHWTVGLHGKNLTDEEYRVGGYNFANLGGDESIIGYYGNPRTVSLNFGYNF